MPKICIKCNAENPDEAKFCKQCGTPFEYACPKCGFINSPDTKYCTQCGKPLSKGKSKKTLIWLVSICLFVITACILAGIWRHPRSQNDLVNKTDTIPAVKESISIDSLKNDTIKIATPEKPEEENRESSNVVGTIKDADGNSYKTIRLGKQVWMKENMRTTHAADGTELEYNYWEGDLPSYFYVNSKSSTKKLYGLLYNLEAALIICPKGWHLPTYEDWEELSSYCGDRYKRRGMAIASTYGWTNSTDESRIQSGSQNDASGFSVPPAGCFIPNNPGHGYKFGTCASFWNSQASDYRPYCTCTDICSKDYISTACAADAKYGKSVRCVRDN